MVVGHLGFVDARERLDGIFSGTGLVVSQVVDTEDDVLINRKDRRAIGGLQKVFGSGHELARFALGVFGQR